MPLGSKIMTRFGPDIQVFAVAAKYRRDYVRHVHFAAVLEGEGQGMPLLCQRGDYVDRLELGPAAAKPHLL